MWCLKEEPQWKEILELINGKKYSEAREELLKLNSVDIATLLEEVDNKKVC